MAEGPQRSCLWTNSTAIPLARGEEGRMLKVLITEDNLILADMLEGYLIDQGYDVCGLASTVDEAVRLADAHKPELAVFDYRLQDGYSTQIRSCIKDKDGMGILYASGDSLKNKLTKNDGDAYIQKPYGMNDLVQALRIVHELKATGDVSSYIFPNTFRLLEDSAAVRRLSA